MSDPAFTPRDRLTLGLVGGAVIFGGLQGLSMLTWPFDPEWTRGVAIVLFGPISLLFTGIGCVCVYASAIRARKGA